jgi:tetratricopeptide (TPR) repeat protein
MISPMKLIPVICFLLLSCIPSTPQSSPAPSDREAFSKAQQVREPAERIKALEQFIKDFPSSSRVARAYSALFDASLEFVGKAVDYAEKSIAATEEPGRPNVYNNIAWTLAEKGVALDKALEFASKAVDADRAQKVNNRTLAMHLDTLAWVKFKRGGYAGAEKDEREAIGYVAGGPGAIARNVEYTGRLGQILARLGTHSEEAAGLLAAALILGDEQVSGAMDEVTARLEPDTGRRAQRKAEILRTAGDQIIGDAAEKDKASTRTRVALGYAESGVLLDEALKIAQESAEAVPKGDLEKYIGAQRALGVIRSFRKEPAAAVAVLQPLKQLASPFDTDIFLHLGRNLEALGRNSEALEAYLAGTAAIQPDVIMQPLTVLYKKINGSETGLPERIDKIGKEYADFKPAGPGKKGAAGRVVLAELFTGAECGPCVAADQAFDHLINVYQRESLAVLEYHLHIPGPDPLTNADTEARAKYYEVRGTPTAVFQGNRSLMGGGPKAMARDRYGLYSFLIDQALDAAPEAKVEVSGELKGSVLAVRASVESGATARDLKLRVALVQESVEYTGGNGWQEHRAVVRQLIGSPGGIPLNAGKAAQQSSVDLGELSAMLNSYLEDFEKNPPERFKDRKDFKFSAKKNEFAGGLSLVAFVQDEKTKEILQAAFAPVR